MLGEHIASQSEVIRAIVVGYSPCCGGPHRLLARRTAECGMTSGPRVPQSASRTGSLAVGETVILLHPPLPPVGVSIGMERGRQQNHSLVNGYGSRCAPG